MRRWKNALPLDIWVIIFKFRQEFTIRNVETIPDSVVTDWLHYLETGINIPVHILDCTPHQSQSYITDMKRKESRDRLIKFLPRFWDGFPQRRRKLDTKRTKTTPY